MKLWLLRPKEDLSNGKNPWNPEYDKAFGFVVRADTEEQAREFAHEDAGDENSGKFANDETADTEQPWKDSKYSTCIELMADGKSGVVIRDFAAS